MNCRLPSKLWIFLALQPGSVKVPLLAHVGSEDKFFLAKVRMSVSLIDRAIASGDYVPPHQAVGSRHRYTIGGCLVHLTHSER